VGKDLPCVVGIPGDIGSHTRSVLRGNIDHDLMGIMTMIPMGSADGSLPWALKTATLLRFCCGFLLRFLSPPTLVSTGKPQHRVALSPYPPHQGFPFPPFPRKLIVCLSAFRKTGQEWMGEGNPRGPARPSAGKPPGGPPFRGSVRGHGHEGPVRAPCEPLRALIYIRCTGALRQDDSADNCTYAQNRRGQRRIGRAVAGAARWCWWWCWWCVAGVAF